MTYQLGVDLGATITTAAVHRAPWAGVVPLGEHSAAMPSVLLWPAEGAPLVGDAAVARAVDEPTRVARGIRPRLTDPHPFVLDGSPFAAGALLGVLLRRVVDVVAEREGGAPEGVVLTHPATWGPAELEAFGAVAGSLGLGQVGFASTAEAAATEYAAGRTLADGATVAVVELGVGSVDTAVLRHRAGRFTVIGTPEAKPHEEDAEPSDRVIADLLKRTLASAHVAPADLDGVLLVGRSTRMGSAAAALGGEIGRPVTTGVEPEHAVAVGAAMVAGRRTVTDVMTGLASFAPGLTSPRAAHPRPAAASAQDPVTGPVGPPVSGPLAAPLAAPRLAAPAPKRSRRHGLAVALAAGAIAIGALGGGAIALFGAVSPAAAESPAVAPPPAPVAVAETTTSEPAPATPETAAVTAPSTRSSATERATPRTRETTRAARPQQSSGSSSSSDHRPGSSSSGSHNDDDHDDSDHGGDDTGTTPGGDTGTTPGGTDTTPGTSQSW
ncbi:Hsp70 family protein [Actinomycetospora flava]|uniref:Hsp70 family protein n=1 Tax=Actinomycetospora flava TaxID=3129232 RepID=A0ABU8M1M0_9PSEU